MQGTEKVGLGETGDEITDTPLGESRWPPVLAIFVFLLMNIAVRIWLPSEGALHVPWLLPTVEGILLVVLLTSDPSTLGARRTLHRLALDDRGHTRGRCAVGNGAPCCGPDQGHRGH